MMLLEVRALTVQDAIREIAEKEGISEMEVLWEIQKAIDEAWAHGGYLQDIIFPEGKPDPITFLKRTAELLG